VLTVRRVLVVIGGGWVAAWTARALFDWILGLDGTLVVILSLVAFALGAYASVDTARELNEWTLWDKRDAYLGWLTFFGIVAVIACLFIPMPWGLMAAAVVAALTIVVLRRSPPVPMEERAPTEPDSSFPAA
jgi:hypothetical protein